jgi:phosphomannomutase
VLAINDDPAMPFPHTPEPRLDTMAQAAAVVKAGRADVGFVHDSDGERLGVVDESGGPLSEELTLPLAAEMMLRAGRVGPVVTNVSTTSAVERVASRHRAKVIRTPVGQAYISEAIVEHRAVIGGEGNGSVVIPEVHSTHDAPAAIVFILDYLAREGQPLSAVVRELPRLAMVKEQIAVEPHLVYTALQEFREAQPEGDGRVVELADGVKVEWPDGWVHVRASMHGRASLRTGRGTACACSSAPSLSSRNDTGSHFSRVNVTALRVQQ